MAQAQALLQSAVESASCLATEVALPFGTQWPVVPIVSAPSGTLLALRIQDLNSQP